MAMTPHTGDQDRDPRLDALYRAGSEPLQPPPRLDDAIRAAARRAVQAGPRRSADRLRRWSVPLSLVAVMVLSVTIVTMMREEGADRLAVDDIAQPRPPQPAAGVAVQKQAAEPPAPAAPPAASEFKAPPPAAPAEQVTAAKPAPAEAGAARERVREQAQARQVEESRESALAKRAADNAAAAGSSSVRDAREDQAPPMAAAPRPLRRAAPAAEADAAGARGQLMAPQAMMGAAAGKSADPLWQDLENEPAAKWLDRLRELRSAGRHEDFVRLSVEFHRRFPDTALPADLR